MLKRLYLLAVALFATCSLFAQTLYDLNTIQKIEINFSIPDWDYRMDTAKAGDEGYLMADWIKINGIQYDSVAVKYKGNSSYDSTKIKNPLHIRLDKYKNQNFEGFKDIKLGNGYGDPSMIREVMAYNILANYMHCPRSNFAQVYINGTYYGIYSSAENIDEKFCADHFYSSKGTFFKCNPIVNPGPSTKSNFRYLGTDSSLYNTYYELKSNKGWNDLVTLCDSVTNNTGSYENMLDIDRIIWMLAFNNTFVNLDSYNGVFAQNHYIYRDLTNHYNPVIWDLNMCFGAFPFAGAGNASMGNQTPLSMQQFSPANHSADDYWPLIKAIQSNDTYRKKYIAHMKTMLNEMIVSGQYGILAAQMINLVDTAVQSDLYKKYTYAQFQSAMNTDIVNGSYTIPGISNLMSGRATYLQSLPEFSAVAPAISGISASNPVPNYNTMISMTATISNAGTAYLGYRFDKRLKFQKLPMYDDGAHNDGAAGDGVFGADVTMSGAVMQYYIYAENADAGMFSPQRAEHEFYSLTVANVAPVAGTIVINEVLSDNKNNVEDEYDDHEDWIEIYNNGNQTINLSNVYLSNNKNAPLKWKFPDNTFIVPDGYVTVWADDDSLEQILHTNFNLNKDTGFVVMSTLAGILDSVSFFAQMSDTSWGRYPNGTGNFQLMNTTFGYQNDGSPLSTVQHELSSGGVKLYPNPANAQLTVTFKGSKQVDIYSVFGNKIHTDSGLEKVVINTSQYAEGIYFVKCEHEVLKFVVAH
jgi:spore coat protein CotH